jgi:hypothetical protein
VTVIIDLPHGSPEFRALTDGLCPDCGAREFTYGPRGGAAQNIECKGCLARFNITRLAQGLAFAQRIPTQADGGPDWVNLPIRVEATLEELATKYPDIEWHKPIPIVWPDGQWFACRVCIANFGLTQNSPWQWLSYADAGRHIAMEHEKGS